MSKGISFWRGEKKLVSPPVGVDRWIHISEPVRARRTIQVKGICPTCGSRTLLTDETRVSNELVSECGDISVEQRYKSCLIRPNRRYEDKEFESDFKILVDWLVRNGYEPGDMLCKGVKK
jgi:hypothetical protein